MTNRFLAVLPRHGDLLRRGDVVARLPVDLVGINAKVLGELLLAAGRR